MKALFLLSFLNIILLLPANAQVVLEEEPEEVFVTVQQEPEFPGGEYEMTRYIQKNIHYPALAKEMNITGKVYIEFVIDRDGSITNVICKKGIGGACDEEAVRVVKAMPKWKPGKQNGKNVKVKYILPIKFDIR